MLDAPILSRLRQSAIALLFAGAAATVVAGASAAPSSAALAQPAPDAAPIYLPLALDDQRMDALPPPATAPPTSPTTSPGASATAPGATVTATPPPSPTPFAPPAPLVHTSSGPVRGEALEGSLRWLGIPYAAPPLGALRWAPPAPPAPWTAPREARAHGPVCPQYEDGELVGDEDCLTLNVWSPARMDGPAPVLVFVHGGGHVQGSSAVEIGGELLYDGQALAEEQGVVLVTLNYRLGPFGFLAHPDLAAEREGPGSGSYGTLDQIAALAWVRDNIAGFGGDATRVTVFGQSAGAVSVCRLIASPLAAGLFQRAALHSGACVATPREAAEAKGEGVAAALGCADAPRPADCLRGRSMAEVMATLDPDAVSVIGLGRNAYDGVVDGQVLPAAPLELIQAGRHQHVPVLAGTTAAETGREAPPLADEAAYQAAVRAYVAAAGLPPRLADLALAAYPASDYPSPRDAYVALTSDVKFVCSSRRAARTLAGAQTEPVFQYSFDHVADNAGPAVRALGAVHGAELPYLFGVLEFRTGFGRYVPGPGDLTVSEAMMAYWARFATSGDPNASGAAGDGDVGDALPDWPRYDADAEPYLRLVPELMVDTRLRGAQCDFWAGLRP